MVRVPAHAARDRGLNAAVDLFLGIAGNALRAAGDGRGKILFGGSAPDSVSGLAVRVVRMMLVRLAPAARHAGMAGALLLQRMRAAQLGLFRMPPVLVRSAGAADPGRVRMFPRHLTGPADSLDSWCSAGCCPGDLAR